jgi:fumarate hydratase class II
LRIKKAAAYANCDLGVLPIEKRDAIAAVCDEILAGKLEDEFPLVMANWFRYPKQHERQRSGCEPCSSIKRICYWRRRAFIKANDDVNKSQSSNDTFPTGMHIAAYKAVVEVNDSRCRKKLRHTSCKSYQKNVVKIGRTHLMDATPLTVGQELSGYVAQLNYGLKAVKNTLAHLSEVALGGTAGTGLNTLLVMMLQLQNTLLNSQDILCNGRK